MTRPGRKEARPTHARSTTRSALGRAGDPAMNPVPARTARNAAWPTRESARGAPSAVLALNAPPPSPAYLRSRIPLPSQTRMIGAAMKIVE